jgi:hypothetical protein
MPKLRCPCGQVHDLSPIPDAGWITVLDARYEDLLATEVERDRLQARAAPTEAFASADARVVDLHGRMFECPSCGRIMWRPPGEVDFRVYVREPSEMSW